jgi:hypothetical protein
LRKGVEKSTIALDAAVFGETTPIIFSFARKYPIAIFWATVMTGYIRTLKII